MLKQARIVFRLLEMSEIVWYESGCNNIIMWQNAIIINKVFFVSFSFPAS